MALPLDLGLLESDKRFPNMCYYLARKEFPQAIPVSHGSWDGGRDIICFAEDHGVAVQIYPKEGDKGFGDLRKLLKKAGLESE
jgi:hypothetical protein